jgi:1-carboxybiuret hydrolase subunit AtzG-like
MATDPLDAFMEAAARALQLPLEPDWRAAVKINLDVTLKHATAVAEFPLPNDAEPAPVFKA